MKHRMLNESEIQSLLAKGCTSSDWNNVQISDPFDPARFRNIHFSGAILVGAFTGHIKLPGGMTLPCGLYDSRIHNCTIDDDVYLDNVRSIANYHVHCNAIIENVVTLIVDGTSSFGNGNPVEALNEGGGRTLTIFDRLSSQIAYMMVLYRHKPKLIKELNRLINYYADSKTSDIGTIGQRCTIANCKTIQNVNFADYSYISGATRLENGTINSCQEDPTTIGDGVVAKNFIILSGSSVDDHSTLSDCFLGQGVKIGKQFSADNSVFFANSEAYHGEACSIFAGPYTVTHHKSTLLIAGLYSFFNAGSSTNQSNHMYKLGPVHQGILERGSKTGSSSYLLWPSKTGPFTVVIGKHYSRFDSSNLPFSYLFEDKGKSVLLPSRNLLTAGTMRDSKKWPKRDRRKDPDLLDLINFDLLSPYTIGRMIKGIEELRAMSGVDSHQDEYVKYKGIVINRFRIDYSCDNYEMAIRIFIGDCLVDQIEQLNQDASFEDVLSIFKPTENSELYDWRDLSGLLAPAPKVEEIIQSIESGEIKNIQDIQQKFNKLHSEYEADKWAWCCSLIEQRLGTICQEITLNNLGHMIAEWKNSCARLREMVEKDSRKEFDATSQIGFGADGDDQDRQLDFDLVRGDFETNEFIKTLQADTAKVEQRAEQVVEFLKRCF